MKIRLYLDEDAMDDDLVDALRARSVDVETAFEAGMIERDDRDQLSWSAEHGRVIYTFNVGHFCALHAEYLANGRKHEGIVVAPQQQYTVGEQMRRLLTLIARRTADEMCNQLEYLSNWSAS